MLVQLKQTHANSEITGVSLYLFYTNKYGQQMYR